MAAATSGVAVLLQYRFDALKEHRIVFEGLNVVHPSVFFVCISPFSVMSLFCALFFYHVYFGKNFNMTYLNAETQVHHGQTFPVHCYYP